MTMIMGRAQRAAIGIELPMLLVLAAVNFTSVVDFLIIMPLGPQYLRELNITSAQFGLTVSAYGIAAGLTGILVSIFLDRVNRKNALLGIYAGFTLATLFCGLVSDYPLLLAVRCLPSIRVSMREANEHQVTRMLQILSRKDHQKALLLMALMTGSSFLVLPYLSNYLIAGDCQKCRCQSRVDAPPAILDEWGTLLRSFQAVWENSPQQTPGLLLLASGRCDV